MLRCRCLSLVPAVVVALAVAADAASVPDLSPTGTYLRPPGEASAFTLGSGGAVEELEGFVSVGGATPATQLSTGTLPAGLSLAFSQSLSPDSSDVLLRYDFTNTGLDPLASLTFVSFVDAEIDEAVNTFFNEYAETSGALAAGQAYEVDEPGFGFVPGDIYDNALAASLDGINSVPFATPDDVSMALSFVLNALAPGQVARFELMLSQDGSTLGGFSIAQKDAATGPTTVITFSGAAAIVPEPGTALLLGVGLSLLAARARRSGN